MMCLERWKANKDCSFFDFVYLATGATWWRVKDSKTLIRHCRRLDEIQDTPFHVLTIIGPAMFYDSANCYTMSIVEMLRL